MLKRNNIVNHIKESAQSLYISKNSSKNSKK